MVWVCVCICACAARCFLRLIFLVNSLTSNLWLFQMGSSISERWNVCNRDIVDELNLWILPCWHVSTSARAIHKALLCFWFLRKEIYCCTWNDHLLCVNEMWSYVKSMPASVSYWMWRAHPQVAEFEFKTAKGHSKGNAKSDEKLINISTFPETVFNAYVYQ